VTGLLNLVSQGTLALNVLWSFIQNMPLAYTTQNPIIIQSWRTMTVIADGLLGLFLVVGTVQILYGQSTRSLEMPLPQFLGRAILTALLIHLRAGSQRRTLPSSGPGSTGLCRRCPGEGAGRDR
jgi:hypothetical protein